ncbi:hypothetical protein QEN19_003486 [Hanseniaspora menglaensis]
MTSISNESSSSGVSNAASNSDIIKKSISNNSIYKPINQSESSSKIKLNIVTKSNVPQKHFVRSPLEMQKVSGVDSESSAGRKTRDSFILSTSFVSTRNRNNQNLSNDRSNNSNIKLLRNESANSIATSSVSPLQDSTYLTNDSIKARKHNWGAASLESVNSSKKPQTQGELEKEFVKPKGSVFLKNSNTPVSPLDLGKRNAHKSGSKDIAFKSRRNTVNDFSKPLNNEIFLENWNTKSNDVNDILQDTHFVDIKAERDLIASEKTLFEKIKQVSSNLNKHYEQQGIYKKLLDDIDKHIMMGSYTTEHINQYSSKLKASDNMQQNASTIKLLEKKLQNLHNNLDEILLAKNELNQRQNSEVFDSKYLLPVSSLNTEGFRSFNKANPYSETSSIHVDSSDNPLMHISKTFQSKEESSYADIKSDKSIFMNNKKVISKFSDIDLNTYSSVTENDTWEVSNCLQCLSEKTSDVDFIFEKSNRLIELLKRSPKLKNELVSSAYLPGIQEMILNENKKIVGSGYRVFRHLLTVSSPDSREIQKIWERSKIEIVLIKSLNNSFLIDSVIEKEQAIKLIRTIMEVSRTVSLNLIQALISSLERSELPIANGDISSSEKLNQEDCIRDASIELLLEMCYLSPANIVQSKCNRLLEDLIIEHKNFKISKIIMETMLNLMTFHETRKHYLHYFSLQFLFDILTSIIDFSEYQSLPLSLLEKCSHLLAMSLKSYTGLMIFANENFQQLKELIQFLKVPYLVKFLIDLFLDVLNIKKMDHFDGMQEKKLFSLKLVPSNLDAELNLIKQYQSIIAKILSECDLSYFLKIVLMDCTTSKENLIKSEYLLSEFKKICGQFLISNEVNQKNDSFKSNDLMKVFYQTSDTTIANPNNDSFFVKMVTNYSQYVSVAYTLNRQSKSTFLDVAQENSLRQLDFNMTNNLDEASFKNLIDQTGVLKSKRYAQWNWELLLLVCKNLLSVNKRLDDLNKNTKFIRRLLVFYRPFRYRFSLLNLKNVKNGMIIIDVGCEFFKVLTKSTVGMKIFNEDFKFFPQIINCFYRLFEGMEEQNVLSTVSLKTTLSSGYIKILAKLANTKEGVLLLEKWNIFSVIYKMFQYNSKVFECLLFIFIRELPLWNSPHPLLVLKKTLVHHTNSIRLLATEVIGYHLGLIPKPKLDDIISLYTENDFNEKEHLEKIDSLSFKQEQELLQLLIQQLYDTSPEVVATADKLLFIYSSNEYFNTACRINHGFVRSISNLIPMIRLVIEQLIMINSPLLYLILTESSGFNMLMEIGYLDSERNKWLSIKNSEYVVIVDQMIQDGLKFKRDSTINSEMPLHFYKILASTELGIRYVASKGDFIVFLNNIREFSMYIEDDNVYSTHRINNLKSSLWSVAFFGSTELGIDIIETTNLIRDLVKIAKLAKNISIKFTCFFVLNVMCSTRIGSELVNEFGWNCSLNSLGEPAGVCLPKDLNSFLTFPEAMEKESNTNKQSNYYKNDIILSEIFTGNINTADLAEYETKEALKNNLDTFDHKNYNQDATGLGILLNDDDANSKSKQLLKLNPESIHPIFLNQNESSRNESINEFCPVSTSISDVQSLAYNTDSFDNLSTHSEDEKENCKITIPVEKFKTEVMKDDRNPSVIYETLATDKLDINIELSNMTMGIDLDDLLFMKRIIDDPTLLNDEAYETELELKKHENMIQKLNEVGKNNFNLNYNKSFDGLNNNVDSDIDITSARENYMEKSDSTDQLSGRIIALVSQMNNHFLLKDSRRELMKYYKDPKFNTYFTQPEIVNKVVDFMATYKFSSHVRKFLCDLFLSTRSIEVLMKKESQKMKYFEM